MTSRYQGGWMSVAYLPDGKQVASAPWDTREAAENDVYQQALMRLAPMPKFDPTKTYEQQIAQRRANHLLESPGDDDQAKLNAIQAWIADTTEPVDDWEWDGETLRIFNGDDVEVYDSETVQTEIFDKYLSHEPEPMDNPECPACGGPGVPLGSLGRRMHFRCRNCGYDFSQEPPAETTPPPKASFYPGSGGSAGVGGITSA